MKEKNKDKDLYCFLAKLWLTLFVLAAICLFLYWCIMKFPKFNIYAFIMFNSNLIFIAFLYCIGKLRIRISKLEASLVTRNVLKTEDLNKTVEEIVEQDIKILKCPKCGYQVFPGDKKCGYCGEELKNTNKSKKR